MNHLPIAKDEPVRRSAKVVNLMDALRKSVNSGARSEGEQATADKGRRKPVAKATESNKRLRLVKPAGRMRKSA